MTNLQTKASRRRGVSRHLPRRKNRHRRFPKPVLDSLSRTSCELRLRDNLNRNIGSDVGHQTHGNRILTDGLDGTERCTNLALLDLKAELIDSFRNIRVGHGTEQTSVDTDLAGNLNGLTVQFVGNTLSRRNTCGLSLLKFRTTCFNSAIAAFVARLA